MRIVRHGYQVSVRRRKRGEIVRWVLRDSKNRYWTGSDWDADKSKATLYADKLEAQCDAAMFEIEATPKHFFTFLNVTVDAPQDFTAEELQDYLQRNLQMYVTHDGGASSLDSAKFEFSWDAELLQEG